MPSRILTEKGAREEAQAIVERRVHERLMNDTRVALRSLECRRFIVHLIAYGARLEEVGALETDQVRAAFISGQQNFAAHVCTLVHDALQDEDLKLLLEGRAQKRANDDDVDKELKRLLRGENG